MNDKTVVNELSLRISLIDFFRYPIDLGVNCARCTYIKTESVHLPICTGFDTGYFTTTIVAKEYCFTAFD